MLSRRAFCCALQTASFAAVAIPSMASATTTAASVSDACAAFTPDLQKTVTPELAIELLKEGHARFAAGSPVRCNMADLVHATEGGQAPFACVIGCIDSRVPVELVFDQQIGDIFTARVAGPVINGDILGSMEFATKVAGAKAIVVLGHSSCGAVKGAVDDVKLGNLTGLLDQIQPAVAGTPLNGEKSSKNLPYVDAVAAANVMNSVAALTGRSPVLKELVDTGALKIVGAMHDVHTGAVTFL